MHCQVSRCWNYVSSPCILRLIGCLRNSQERTKRSWVCIGMIFSFLVEGMLIITRPLSTTLEASPLRFLTTDWVITKSKNAPMFVTMWSEQPLSTSMTAAFHGVRAAQYASSGVDNVWPIATDSSFFSCMPCLGDRSQLAALCCLLPPAVLGRMFRDPTYKAVSSLGSLLEVTLHCQCH